MDKTILKNHLVNNPTDSFWDDLEGAWLFDDGAGTDVTDYSGNERTAAISKSRYGTYGDYSWDNSVFGQEFLDIAFSVDAVGGGSVDLTLGSALSAGDPNATMFMLFSQDLVRPASCSMLPYFALGKSKLILSTPAAGNILAHVDDTVSGTSLDTAITSYVAQHTNLNIEFFKNCVTDFTDTIDALDADSDDLFMVQAGNATGDIPIVSIQLYAVMLWSRILTQTEINYICTALSGENPWGSSNSSFLIMF